MEKYLYKKLSINFKRRKFILKSTDEGILLMVNVLPFFEALFICFIIIICLFYITDFL